MVLPKTKINILLRAINGSMYEKRMRLEHPERREE